MTSHTDLTNRQGLPASVKALLEAPDVAGLEKALDGGLPANVASQGGIPLFEHLLAALERKTRAADALSVPPAPLSLLEAFFRHGLTNQAYYEGQATVVSMALHYGQWGWARHLVEKGFPVEGPNGSALLALVDGRLQRAVSPGGIEPPAPQDEPAATSLSSNVHWLGGQAAAAAENEGPSPVWMDDSLEEQGNLEQLVGTLVRAGARLEMREDIGEGQWGLPPLMRAIVNLDRTCVVALAKAGADLETRPEGLQQRPLELAIAGGSEGIVRALIEAGAPLGADPSLIEEQAIMNRPLVLAARRGLAHLIPVIAEAMEKPEVERWGVVAMHFAAAHGHVPALRALRLEGIPYDAKSLRGGFVPLHQAASGGHPDTIAFLLRRGQKWDAANDAGMTPADVLRSRHPGLVAQFGLSLGDNVRMIFPGRAKPKR